jgi:hypothetical protein
MGQLVFQATLGGQVNLVGPNTASTFNLNVPATSSTIATLTGTETFTNKTLTSPTLTTPVLGTPSSGTLTSCTGLPVGGITATGTPSSTTFLRGDSSWATIATNAISNGTSNVTVNSSGGTITAATAGTTAITVDTSQNVGIGNTPSSWATYKVAQVGGGTADVSVASNNDDTNISTNAYYNAGWKYQSSSALAERYQQGAGTHRWYYAPSGTAGNAITWSEAMRIDSGGNLLVGTTTLLANERLIAQNAQGASWVQTINNTAASFIGSGARGLFIQYTATPNSTSNAFWDCYDTAGTTRRGGLMSNGGLANYSANNTNLSDRREKTDFAPADSYLSKICAIPVQTYKYIDQSDDEKTLGVVAQDVQEIAPELVTESNWGSEEEPKMRLSIYQTDLQYALMKSIQELKKINDTQAETLTQQTEAINALTARIVALEAK